MARRKRRVIVQPQAYDASREDWPPVLPAIAERDARTWTFLASAIGARHPVITPLQTTIVDTLVQAVARGQITRYMACERKKVYRTPSYAAKVAERVTRQFGVRQVAYPCPFCHAYHLATRPEDKHERA